MLDHPYDCLECKTTHDYYGDCPTREINFVVFTCDCGLRQYAEIHGGVELDYHCKCGKYFKRTTRIDDDKTHYQSSFRVKRDD